MGLLVGVPAGIALELTRRTYNEAATEAMVREFESKGTSPPLMIDYLKPWAVPVWTAIASVLLAVLIYVIVIGVRRVTNRERPA